MAKDDSTSDKTTTVSNDPPPGQGRSRWGPGALSFALLLLGASATEVIRLNLTPVYGAVATELFHKTAIVTTALLALLLKWIRGVGAIPDDLSVILPHLPVHAFLIPAILHYTFIDKSTQWGPAVGPVAAEAATSLPLLLCAFYATFQTSYYFRNWKIQPVLVDILISAAACACIFVGEALTKIALSYVIGTNAMITRSGLLFLVACNYASRFPSKYLLIAIPCVWFLLQVNPHTQWETTTAHLNETLKQHHWSLLERRDSTTGYLSVLENIESSYRVLRCDHSLLGGVWHPNPERSSVPEPVYAVFTVLEAVRLMQIDGQEWNSTEKVDKKALVIGLGIGTCPKNLHAHGINTSVIEIDPGVHDLAMKYFDFPKEITVVHSDATNLLLNADKATARFDYIVHDVFTGGNEPPQLFTFEFLHLLSRLLSENGTISINYAGTLDSPRTALVFNTIASVFHRCRLFRDGPEDPQQDRLNGGFINMVAFCTKRDVKWSFRGPVEADFLDSIMSRENLLPSYEIEWPEMEAPFGETDVLRKGQESTMNSDRIRGAMHHWEIMRTVVPDVVWEHW